MELSRDLVKNLVETRPRKKEIEQGIRHQERLRFHTQTTLRKWDLNSAYQEFRYWIESESPQILPKDKATRVLQFIRPPISTVELTESIFSKLRKVFHGQDSFFDYQFSNPDLKIDWELFRDQTFWPTHGFQAMQSAIDSVWIVDFPEVQTGSRPEPIDRLIDIQYVIDIQNDIDNNCHYLIYASGKTIVVYDSVSITQYDANWNEMFSIPHGLGYTPARMMWSERLVDDNLINKESPITKELSDLDWYLLHKSAKKYMDLANSYPMTVMYSSDDDSQDPRRTDDKDRPPAAKQPAGSKLMGPGTNIEVDPPADGQDSDLMKNPIKLISPEVDTLEWHVSEENRLKNDIYKSVTGIDRELNNEQAKNEKQVDSAFESQLAVLLRVKKNFEIINKFADSTKARLRYGDSFIRCTIDYGTSFFLKTVSELQEDYKLAKESGNEVVMEKITSNILDSKYRSDATNRQRAEIIRDLDPLPEKTDKEAIDIFKNGGLDKINFIIKTNLLNFVRRFERDNLPLTEFGANIEYNSKIDQIINRFKDYASKQGPDSGDSGDGS